MPYHAYKTYLSLRNHLTKESYDYHKYGGKSRASVNLSISARIDFGLRNLHGTKTTRKSLISLWQTLFQQTIQRQYGLVVW